MSSGSEVGSNLEHLLCVSLFAPVIPTSFNNVYKGPI